MSTVECSTCGAAAPAGSRFCPQCATPLPAETPGARSDYWRFWPPDAWLVAAGLLAAAGIVLLGAELWLWAALLLLAAAAVILLRLLSGGRPPSGVLGVVWGRLSAHREVVSARSRGQLALFRLRRELAELQAERSRRYHDLGRAAYLEDERSAAEARSRLDELSAQLSAKEEEIVALVGALEERVRRLQFQVAPTQRLEAPPEPARVPEPSPPPDEGTPPEPARVPEPSPPPDEGAPPEPARVPEPSPDAPVPEPEHPPTPQSRRRRASRA
ncbi:MAG TPA: hypothetical protein VD704_02585 [Gaiellaceae bacterium]|nr:hypothetical protein [Gaiellaceae bacterium]